MLREKGVYPTSRVLDPTELSFTSSFLSFLSSFLSFLSSFISSFLSFLVKRASSILLFSPLYQEALFLDLIVSMEVGLYHGLSCDEKLWVGVRCSCIAFRCYFIIIIRVSTCLHTEFLLILILIANL